jgi:MFS family permease
MPSVTLSTSRPTAWLQRWGGVLPLFAAELIVWLGFGALLPVLPIWFQDHGVDLALLGIVIAAWPAARLVGEPIFGWLADRTRRVPLMVGGLLVAAVALGLPLVLTSPAWFLALRALAGFATAVYDPAARGYITDATPPDRRGEAFGLYGAAQMAGLLLGPAIGAFGADRFGGIGFVFVFSAVATVVAAVAVALRVRETPTMLVRRRASPPPDDAAEGHRDAVQGHRPGTGAPASLLNRWLVAAIALNVGGYIAGGTYEVIWSLFLKAKGAGLDLIGLTFMLFALPVLLFSPFAGRLVDRRGPYAFVVVGGLGMAIASFAYTVVGDPVHVIPILLAEATAFAMLTPALYAMVAHGSPRGRSSTAQGLFGAAGTLGTIVASVATGFLAERDLRYPFWTASVVMFVFLALGLAIGGREVRRRPGGAQQRDGLATAAEA